MNSNNNNISNTNHIIKWTYKINCDKTAEKIDRNDITIITNDKIIIPNIVDSFYQVDTQSVKIPNFIKQKVKSVYRNSRGVVLIIYDNYTTYLRCDTELVGKLF